VTGRTLPPIGLFVITAGASWLAMMVFHECGHILHAILSGGRIARVVLHPLVFSRTDVSPNPHPLLVAWGGVAWGWILPLAIWLPLRHARLGFLLQFFAGFCLLANGAYLASGVLVPAGDTDDLLRLGVPRWVMALCGIPLCACGLTLWNGLGPRFGLGKQPVDRLAMITAAVALVALIVAMLAWSALTRSHAP